MRHSALSASLFTATLFLLCMTILTSCNDKPTDVGSDLVPGTDTIYAESTVSSELLKLIGTKTERSPIYNSAYVLFGKTADSEARMFVEFIQWPDVGHPDTFELISAELEMFPQAYVYGDTNDVTLSLSSYELQQVWSANATWDSIWASDGSTSYYSTGQPPVAQHSVDIQDGDSVVRIPFDLTAAKRWLTVGMDSTSTSELFGLVLLPENNGSIKQFRNLDGNTQIMRLRVVTRRNDTSALDTSFVEAAVACFVDTPVAADGETLVQGARVHTTQYEIRIDSLPPYSIIAGSRFVVTVDMNNSSVGNLGADELLALTYVPKSGNNITLVTRRNEWGVYEFSDMVNVMQRIRSDGGVGTITIGPTDVNLSWRMNRLRLHGLNDDATVRPYLSVIYIIPEVFN